MGAVSPFRILLISILLMVTAYLVHSFVSAVPGPVSKAALREVFERVDGWNGTRDQSLSDQVVGGLKLDDYIFRGFERGADVVTLYIGYYRTAKKVGAAHDPLVCFQGQGWVVAKQSRGRYTLVSSPAVTLSYSSMIAERQGERVLVVYWFQANRNASANSFYQKIALVRDRLTGHGQDNAFVRITTTIGNGSPELARKKVFDFVEATYPRFHTYMAK